ncbi:MAG: hypothetical protein HYS86_02860 [Candidatus Chisholmbacteria bacterium]|nr:hypothetical protein [Candidatus Chisholmbacteria bacterium]
MSPYLEILAGPKSPLTVAELALRAPEIDLSRFLADATQTLRLDPEGQTTEDTFLLILGHLSGLQNRADQVGSTFCNLFREQLETYFTALSLGNYHPSPVQTIFNELDYFLTPRP